MVQEYEFFRHVTKNEKISKTQNWDLKLIETISTSSKWICGLQLIKMKENK